MLEGKEPSSAMLQRTEQVLHFDKHFLLFPLHAYGFYVGFHHNYPHLLWIRRIICSKLL
jgi:hypothetical protein